LVALLDCFVIEYPSTYPLQIAILVVSTFLFIFNIFCVVLTIRYENEKKLTKLNEARKLKGRKPKSRDSVFHLIKWAFLGETWLEFLALLWGWIFIFWYREIAVFRVVRIFRFVWYLEMYTADKNSPFYVFLYISHIILQYLERIGQELFTTKSQGGNVILIIFFYTAYIAACTFWQKTSTWLLISPEGGPNGNVSECDTLSHCFLIMLRLTFWDGSGFDFLKSIIDNHSIGLAILLFIYMCFSAMVLLNGLIGIFGGAFNDADPTVDEDSDDDEEKIKRREEFNQDKKTFKKYFLCGESDEEYDDEIEEEKKELKKEMERHTSDDKVPQSWFVRFFGIQDETEEKKESLKGIKKLLKNLHNDIKEIHKQQ